MNLNMILRKNISSKSIICISLLLIIAITMVGCSNSSNDNTIEKEVISKEENNEYKIIDAFIKQYNNISNVSIDNIKNMDLKGDDYKTEFRLNAFKNAVGKKGSIGKSSISIVNYGVWSNDSIRFYITSNSQKEVTRIYTNLIHTLDKSISDNDIQKSYSAIIDGYDANILLGEAGYISGYINNNEIFIDCTKLNFIE